MSLSGSISRWMLWRFLSFKVTFPFIITAINFWYNGFFYLAILVLRIWYLFPRSTIARALVVLCLVIYIVASVTSLALTFTDLRAEKILLPGLRQSGCVAPAPRSIWHLFLPTLILHTILFLFTTVRAITSRQMLRSAPLLKRLVLEYVTMFTEFSPSVTLFDLVVVYFTWLC